MVVNLNDLRGSRHEQVRELLSGNGFDHALLQLPDNIRYATDYRTLVINESSDHVLCLFAADGSVDIFGSHIRTAAGDTTPDLPWVDSVQPLIGWVPLHVSMPDVIAAIAAALNRHKVRKVAYDVLHPVILEGLKEKCGDAQFVCIVDLLNRLRRRKSESERALMKRAAVNNLKAVWAAFQAARPGMTDREVLAVALSEQQRNEAELITHFTCNVHSGHDWFPGGRELIVGESIFLDQVYYGRGGYASDITRTAFIGEPPAVVQNAYKTLLEINQDIMSYARPGVDTADLDKRLNTLLRKAGLEGSPYGIGHGIGLRVMEAPALFESVRNWTLELHDTVAIEPETAITANGKRYTLKIEDCYEVGVNGLEPLLETSLVEEMYIVPA